VNIYAKEAGPGGRFAFGRNWWHFLSVVDDERVAEARASLCTTLGVTSLKGLSFLDIGSGSGLFSLAAAQLDAARVHSFDSDAASVECTRELKRRFLPEQKTWSIDRGSALDRGYLQSLGTFDVVYAWGVLHHTGDMFRALENAALPVCVGGKLCLAIYNDQGLRSRVWRTIKRTYNRLPYQLRTPYMVAVMAPRELRSAAAAIVRLHPVRYVRSWTDYKHQRGMSRWYDLVDWVGGYPFEVAKPEVVFSFYAERGFSLVRLETCGGGLGCNQFVLVNSTTSA
jgi:2-polyprenyl-3-methyl-5-hydroxy-6-metoxy-1,4-benzoquinol methylase